MDKNCTSKDSDYYLVQKSLQDPDCFAFLVKRYQDKLFRYISRISNFSKQDIEDLLQEIFITVYINLADFDEKMSSFSAWIYRIARNKTIDEFRKRKIRPEGNYISIEDNILSFLYAGGDNIFTQIDTKIAKEKLNMAIKKLNSLEKEAIELRFYENKSYLEISDILQVPVGTVSTLIARAKKKLQKELKNYKF